MKLIDGTIDLYQCVSGEVIHGENTVRLTFQVHDHGQVYQPQLLKIVMDISVADSEQLRAALDRKTERSRRWPWEIPWGAGLRR